MHSPESALQRVVTGPGPVTAAILRDEGFNDEAINFAMEERLKSAAQLEREGWNEIAVDFLLRNADVSSEELQIDGNDEAAIAIMEKHTPLLQSSWREVQKWYGDRDGYERDVKDEVRRPVPHDKFLRGKLREFILRSTLR